MSTRRPRRTAKLAQVDTSLNDLFAVIHWVARLRSDLTEATTAPNAARRTAAFQNIWGGHAEAQKRLGAIKSPGLARRVAELRRELDAAHYDATVAACRLSQRRGGDVVSLAEARARRASGLDNVTFG